MIETNTSKMKKYTVSGKMVFNKTKGVININEDVDANNEQEAIQIVEGRGQGYDVTWQLNARGFGPMPIFLSTEPGPIV